jgi:hypothetical protein
MALKSGRRIRIWLPPEQALRSSEKTLKHHTTPWTIFLYTNNHLRPITRSFQNIPCILGLRPHVPIVLKPQISPPLNLLS